MELEFLTKRFLFASKDQNLKTLLMRLQEKEFLKMPEDEGQQAYKRKTPDLL